jgi:hypothetical protein
MSFEVTGINAVHAVITDDCRRNKGTENAFREAVERIMSEAHKLNDWHSVGSGVKFHVILAVEMPKGEETEPSKEGR